ncbi:MAG TPA: tetratricopeptide repeat protein [Polyangiaceae bacterium]|nr:tetratricopeptide repeat protein [Polyangiaceae bacterium]
MWRVLASRPRGAVALATCAAYVAALIGPFQFDDYDVIVRYAPVHSLSAWWAALGHGIRPLLKLTYALNWALGASVFGFHLFNVLVHLLNTELVMRLCTAASDPEQRWPFEPRGRTAFAAGLLFAIHPLQTEAVTYISGRSSSLMALFVLAALLFYVQGVRAASRRWLALAGLAFVCALLTKEIAATLPLGLVLWEWCFERSRLRAVLVRQAAFGGLVLGIVVLAILHPSYYTLLFNALGVRPLLEAIAYQVAGAGYLLSRLILLHRLSIDPGLGLAAPSPLALAGASVVLLLLGAVALTQRRKRSIVTFGIAWFFVQAFLPYVFVQRQDVINERHVYLACFGVFAALGALWSELSERSRHSARWHWAGVTLAALFVIGTAARNLDYRSRLALWQSTVRVSPHNPRAHNNLGVALELSGRDREAHAAYAQALQLDPDYEMARRNLERVMRR